LGVKGSEKILLVNYMVARKGEKITVDLRIEIFSFHDHFGFGFMELWITN